MLVALAIIIIIGLVIVIYYLRSILSKLSVNTSESKEHISSSNQSVISKDKSPSIIKKNVMTFDHIGKKEAAIKVSDEQKENNLDSPITQTNLENNKPLEEETSETQSDPIDSAFSKMQSQTTQYELDILSSNYEDDEPLNNVTSISIDSIVDVEEKTPEKTLSAEEMIFSVLNSENDFSQSLKDDIRDIEIENIVETEQKNNNNESEVSQKKETEDIFNNPTDNNLDFANLNSTNLFNI